MRRLALPAVLAALAVLGGVLAAWPEAAARRAVAVTSPVTPVLSARRVPRLLAGFVAEVRLARALDGALDAPDLAHARRSSCLVVNDAGQVLYARNPDLALLPASNLKLLTGLAVLRRLGPTTRLTTGVRGAVGPGGVVAGDLWLVGGGDPLLATADYAAAGLYQPHPHTALEELAGRVAAAGVKVVRGSVVGDESRYDTQRYLPTWSPRYRADNEIGPQSALTVNGGFLRWKPVVTPAPDPAAGAAAVFGHLLEEHGITVIGAPRAGTAPPDAPALATIASLPIAEIVGEMLKESDNLTAELLTKELGRAASGQGTTAAGVAAVRATLSTLGLPLAGLVAVDGSGLDRSDRAPCALLVRVLLQEGERSDIGRGLPIAHRDGTLHKRFAASPAADRLRAKTGTLDGVAALSGFVDTGAGTVTFSLLVNGLPAEALGPRLWEEVGTALARFPDAPDPATLGPTGT